MTDKFERIDGFSPFGRSLVEAWFGDEASLADHPFSSENIARESGAPSKSEAAWDRWAAECERLLGHDLDGNDVAYGDTPAEGYSLDEAFECFNAGHTAHAYVAMVTSRERYSPRVLK